MTKEEVKQYLRSQIDSTLKIQSIYNKDVFFLCYNNSYIRVFKLSKITGQPVNNENFKGGDIIFGFNTKSKEFMYFKKIRVYLKENYSNDYYDIIKIIEEVLKEYKEYKDYRAW